MVVACPTDWLILLQALLQVDSASLHILIQQLIVRKRVERRREEELLDREEARQEMIVLFLYNRPSERGKRAYHPLYHHHSL